LANGNDYEIMAVKDVGNKPSAVYFMPVVTFLVLLYFKMQEITLDEGFISALFGVSVVTLIITTGFVGFGIITEKWYTLETRASNLWGEILIAILSLFSTAFTFWVIGLSDDPIPTLNNIVWFIYGFIFYQFMWIGFNSFYKHEMFRSQRLNVVVGIIVAFSIGSFSVYMADAIGLGVL